MAFEIFEKGRTWTNSISPEIISITKSTISFGQKSLDEFQDNDFVEVYLDRKNNKVGFKPCNNSTTGFRLINKSKTGRRTSTGKFLELLPLGQYKAEVEGKFVVIKVPEIVGEKKTVNL